ncbi:MAG: IclR family transcriptional regulator [Proteobacteria bacterium]|nr:IclR family transcriptional regulator [Pseudomonadota bacterium]MBU1452467.1 IclR family transcriptional regulator [Pseudomonadota bacterium]MBU2467734.1 IclR family transcriptional regulator [Pseudomonadota bacterium]MBU2518147.1 IclR family transcriptional regulator [Pseudomonadota bacterium]
MPVKVVESLLKGLKVLEVVARHPQGHSLPGITRDTGLPKATAYRLLQTLVASNYLHYFEDTAKYRLGPKVMSLGMSSLASQDIAPMAEPYLQELSKRIGQNVNLGIPDGGEVVYIIRIKVRRILGIDLAVGSRLSAHNTAVGLALLAFLEPQRLQDIVLELSRDPRISQQIGLRGDNLLERLARIRELGYALGEDEYFAGLTSVAVPVFNQAGYAEAAINVPVFSQLCSKQELLGEYLPLVLETAQTISQLRGHAPGSQPVARSQQ